MLNATPKEIAEWMLQEFEKSGMLYQSDAADGIIERFGEQHTYTNENGNPAIDSKILAEFRKLTTGKAVWSRGDQCWERPPKDHPPGQRMID